jgi:cytochrome c2
VLGNKFQNLIHCYISIAPAMGGGVLFLPDNLFYYLKHPQEKTQQTARRFSGCHQI